MKNYGKLLNNNKEVFSPSVGCVTADLVHFINLFLHNHILWKLIFATLRSLFLYRKTNNFILIIIHLIKGHKPFKMARIQPYYSPYYIHITHQTSSVVLSISVE